MANETAWRTDRERRASMCASCGMRANAVSVTCGDGMQTITYRCLACDRTWENRAPEKKPAPLGANTQW